MTIGGGEAADQMVRMMLSGGEVIVRLGGSALKNLLALTMALARNNKALSGKVNMERMLRETRDLRLFPMSPEQYKQFQKHAKRQKILFSAIKDRDGRGRVIDVLMPVTELDRANLIFERILYQGPVRQAPEQGERAPSEPQRDRQEPSPDQDRGSPQRARKGPQEGPPGQERPAPQAEREDTQRPPAGRAEDRWDPPPPRSQLPDDPWDIPPKNGSQSQPDSPDTRASSSASRESGGRSERPSILARLEGYRVRLSSGERSAPVREKSRAKPKQR
jgi:hypothetical protein